MAIVTIPAEDRRLTAPAEIADFLATHGIEYRRWPLEDRVDPAAPAAAILAAYDPEIEELKRRGGFVTADVIDVYPDTPNLDAMLAKFSKEHTHTEDEVRFILQGRGVFAGTRHWFDLCTDRRIRAIRLFQDQSGWTPFYVADGVHAGYVPLCLGPAWVAGTGSRGS